MHMLASLMHIAERKKNKKGLRITKNELARKRTETQDSSVQFHAG